jgi:alpha-beta hydrolase superfamily lysophospholipase
MSANRTQLTLTSDDGTQLAAQRWAPLTDAKAALLVVHGYADHAERYREVAVALAERGIDTVAVDLRGHGHSAGQRGFISDWSEYIADVETAFGAMTTAHSGHGIPRFVLGHSNGALVALDWVADKKPDIHGLIVTNPFLQLAMKVSPLKIGAGHIAARIAPRIALPSGIDAEVLTHETAIVDAYRRDPMVFGTATAGWFRASRKAQARVRALTRIGVPLLYVHSDGDRLASPEANAALAAQLESPDKTVVVRKGEMHEVLNETNRAELFARVGEWIVGHC